MLRARYTLRRMSMSGSAHEGRAAVTVVAPPRLRFLLAAAVFLFITAYSVAISGLGDPLPIGGRIAWFGPLGLITGSFLGLASARCTVRGDIAYVHWVTVTHRVRLSEIVVVDAANGVALCLVSGRRIRVVRRGIPGRRARRAAQRLQDLLGPLDAEPGPPRDDTTVTSVRWTILVFTIALIALAVWLSGVAASSGSGD